MAIGLVTIQRWADAAVGEALQVRLELSMAEAEAVKEADKHVRVYLVVRVPQRIADDPGVEGSTVKLAANTFGKRETALDHPVLDLSARRSFALICGDCLHLGKHFPGALPSIGG